MTNKRKAAIGYATYVLGGRVARRVVRRRTRRFLGRLEAAPRRRSRRLPLIGGAAAVAAGAAVAGAVAVRRHRAADTD
jgi:hypothetical protein